MRSAGSVRAKEHAGVGERHQRHRETADGNVVDVSDTDPGYCERGKPLRRGSDADPSTFTRRVAARCQTVVTTAAATTPTRTQAIISTEFC